MPRPYMSVHLQRFPIIPSQVLNIALLSYGQQGRERTKSC